MIQNILESTSLYFIELLKLFSFCILILKIQIKHQRAAVLASLSSLLLFFSLSCFTDILQYGIPLGIMPMIILILCMKVKKRSGLILLAYLLICASDTIISALIMLVLQVSVHTIKEHPLLLLFTDSITLFLILFLAKRKKYRIPQSLYFMSWKLVLLFAIGLFSLIIYIAAIQVTGFTDGSNYIQNLMTFSLSILGIVFLITGFLLLSRQSQLAYLQKESELSQNLLTVQKDYYLSLLEKETETRKFRHDIQNHFTCLHTLYLEKNYSELGNYLSQLDASLQELKPSITTGNNLVDAITADISRRHSQVHLEWKGLLPNELQISSMDLCTVFSNLLSNAFEAAEQIKPHSVYVSVKVLESSLLLAITNSAASAPVVCRGEYLSTKEGKNHGFGIRNVIQCIEKNGGHFETFFENGLFTAEVILLDAIRLKSA